VNGDGLDPGPDGPPPVTGEGSVATGTPGPDASAPLSASDRAAAFTTGRVPVDRAAAFRAGTTPIPRRFAFWAIIGFAVLGIGGVIAEHVVGNSGVQTAVTTPVPTLAGTGGSDPAQQAPTGPTVPASPAAVIGLTHVSGGPATPIDLRSQSGAPWSLADVRGRTVVLTFLNAECNDICPVLGQEITQADQLLGAQRSSVEFVVVNTDPLETSLSVTPPALTQTGLDHLGNVTFLTGSLPQLASVWKNYGVTVAVSNTTRLVSHNDLIYFIAPDGRLTLRSTPFGNESPQGIYSLDPSTIHTFAVGLAAAAAGLTGKTT